MPRRALALALSLAFFTLALAPLSTADAQTRRRRRGTPPARIRGGAVMITEAPPVPAPSEVLGFTPGDDRKLASWSQVVEYFRRLDAASDRVKFEELGKTTMGAPFVMATISSPENLARLDEFREIQRQLADPRTLGRNPDRRAAELISRGRSVVLITCGIHSTEVGSTLSSMLIAHRLASSDDPEIRKVLRESIVLLVPSLNPDGVDIVKNWYDKTLGTPYEGTSPPELYHKYIGHDNNRDWYIFSQVETQLTVDKIHNVWHPQIVHDIHQQGAAGSRLFLPPYMAPVEPNVPKQLVEGYTELGSYMAAQLRAKGFKGITTGSTYDAWTPARAYSHYHGGVRILSETASANIATPMTLKLSDLRSREGYDPQKESDKFGPVWPGGAWHLRDITSYMTAAAFELLRHAADNRERWLRRFYDVGREAVRPRRAGELYGFKIDLSGDNGAALSRLLERGGVEVESLASGGARRRGQPRPVEAESFAFVRMAQPYGAFAKALLERQTYPDLRDERGQPIQPYDVTAHTLPLLMGVGVEPVYSPVRTAKLTWVETLAPAESPAESALRGARVALYKSHVASMDEGWTRFILERNRVRHGSLLDAEVRAGNLRAKYDAIIIPDQQPRVILSGYRAGSMPPELTGGLGEEGVKALREFVEQGGTLVTFNDASTFAIEALKLPVRNIAGGWRRTEFFVPGSILRTEIDTSHPVAAGMPGESIAWVEDSPVFEFDAKDANRVRIVARYPTGDPLLSGWLLGGRKLSGKAALLDVSLGRGRVYLFGFRPQYRAQSLATYPLIFNAISQASKR